MKMKKMICAALALCLIAAFLPLAVSAEEMAGGSFGDLTWSLDETGTMTISGTGKMGSDIPWEKFKADITALVVEEGVTTVAQDGFSGCTDLASVSLPETLEYIGKAAFFGCSGLRSIKLPSGLKTIDSNAFSDCTGLTEVTIPASVTSLGARPFAYCTKLAKINVESGNPNYSSDQYGVLYNKSKTEILEVPGAISGAYTIPATVTSVAWGTFSGCTKLTSVVLPEGIDTIDMETFVGCTSLTSVTIPNTVTWIASGAFTNCTALKEITIPASVRDLDPGAFEGCTGLKKIVFEGDAPGCDGGVFIGVTATAYYPAGNATWTQQVRENLGAEGSITWVADCVGDHTVVTDPAVEATCTKTGLTEGKHCSVCGTVLTAQETVPAKGHSYGAWEQTKAPAVGVQGEERRECSVCGAYETRTLAALAGTETEPAETTQPETTVPDTTAPAQTPPETTAPEETTGPESAGTEEPESTTAVPEATKPAGDSGSGSGGGSVGVYVLLAVLFAAAGGCIFAIVKLAVGKKESPRQ